MSDNQKEYDVVEIEKYEELTNKEDELSKLKRKLILEVMACGSFALLLLLNILDQTVFKIAAFMPDWLYSIFLASLSLSTLLKIIETISKKSKLNVDIEQIKQIINETENKNQGQGFNKWK